MTAERTLSWEYIAGIFDGEGSVFIQKQNPTGKASRYTLYANIVNTHEKAMSEIGKQIDGKIYMERFPSGKMKYQIILSGPKAKKFLRDVLPHLIVKKKQAFLALRYPTGSVGKRLSSSDKELRDYIYYGLKELKNTCQ